MSNKMNSSPNIHHYKLKRGTLALNFFSLVFMGIVLGIPFIMLVTMLISFIRTDSKLDTFTIIMSCFIIPIVILLGFILIQMTFNVIMYLFSYIKVTPDGIEQKQSPYKHIRCNWSDVDKLGKLFLITDVIYLNSYEVLSFSLSLKSPFRFLRPKQGFISLTGYEGWSDGQLADDLKQYAPKLFENQPTPQVAQSESYKETKTIKPEPETSSISQEIRLLAAISHASVLFPYIGLIVPGGIYLTQKKKSSYLGFQSLQALIWQIVVFVLRMLTSSCMVGSIFIPILLATSAQNERIFELLSGGVFIATIISGTLMLVGNLAFVIYGIIGAVMTYQGKDFRYVFIGNRINKGKGDKPINNAHR